MGGISIWQLLIVLAIVVLVFGTKKIKSLGGDLGSALKSFKKAVKENNEDEKNEDEQFAEKPQLNKEQNDEDLKATKAKQKNKAE